MPSGLGDGVQDSGSHAYQIGLAALGGSAMIVIQDRRGATTLEALAGTAPASVVELIEQWGQWEGAIESLLKKSGSRGLDLSKLEWLPPVMPRKLICIGANYSDHNQEMPGAVSTPVPYSFMKPPTTALIGSGRTIRLPEHAAKIDYEAELAVVIGRHAHLVPSESALSFVFGYSVLNDVSARDWMPTESPLGPDWTMLKGFDESAPMGPWITPAKFVSDPQNLDISLSVNGRVKQDSNTSQMIFTVAQVIQHLASLMTLEPGDVIATGTPSGVGFGRKPQEFLKPGDEIRVEVEGLGVLENRIAAIEPDATPSPTASTAARA